MCLWHDRAPCVFPWPRSRKLRKTPPLRWSTAFSWVKDFISVQLHKICCYYKIVHFWGLSNPQWARASSFTRFVAHTQRRATVGRTPLDEWSARRRDLCITRHHPQQTDVHAPMRFEPTISAGEWPQTYLLDRAATGSGNFRITKCKIQICAPDISELGLVSTVFEVLVTHSQKATVHLFVLSVACLVSNCVPKLGAAKHPDVRPQYAPIHFLCPVSTAAVHVGATGTFSLLYLFLYNCRNWILIHLMGFISYPYGLGPWHASTGNWILKLRTVFRYVVEHLGYGICLLLGLCRDRTPKTQSIISTLILTKTSIHVLTACAVFSSDILHRLFSK